MIGFFSQVRFEQNVRFCCWKIEFRVDFIDDFFKISMHRSFIALEVLDGTKTPVAQLQNQKPIKTNFCLVAMNLKIPFL